MPAVPPAIRGYQCCHHCHVKEKVLPIRFVAAEAGFLPPGPLTFLADIEDATRGKSPTMIEDE